MMKLHPSLIGSYYGCATAVKPGRMVAHPTDLASGQPQGRVHGIPVTAAIKRYLTAANVGSIAAPSSRAPVASGGGPSGGGSQ